MREEATREALRMAGIFCWTESEPCVVETHAQGTCLFWVHDGILLLAWRLMISRIFRHDHSESCGRYIRTQTAEMLYAR